MKRETRVDAYIPTAFNKAADRRAHSAIEVRFKEIYGKWPSALELIQAKPFLKKRWREDEEE